MEIRFDHERVRAAASRHGDNIAAMLADADLRDMIRAEWLKDEPHILPACFLTDAELEKLVSGVANMADPIERYALEIYKELVRDLRLAAMEVSGHA